MFGRRLVPCALLLATMIALSWSCLVGPASAQAEPASAQAELPFQATTVLGPRGVSARADVELVGDETVLRLTVGRDAPEARVRGVTGVGSVESLDTSAGRIVVIRASGVAHIAAVFVWAAGHARLAWSGRLDLHGDAGERWADALEIVDRTGDGVPDVVVGMVREGIGRCDETSLALIAPRALTARGELRSVELSRLPAGASTFATAFPQRRLPLDPEPLLPALRFVGATSWAGQDPMFTSPPRVLTDADPSTVWAEGRPGDGRGELLVARWESSAPITMLRFRGGAGVALPRVLWVFIDGERLSPLELGDSTDATFIFSTPLVGSCLSFVIGEGAEGSVPTGFGEISAYTAYDEGDGITDLVDELVQEGSRGDDVATWMGRLGAPACAALDEAWDRLSMLGRLRAMRVAGSVRDPAATALLARGATDEHEEVRQEAVRRLVAARAYDALAAGAIRQGGDTAALALAADERAAVAAPGALFEALETERERPAFRAAAGRIAAHHPEAARAFAASTSAGVLSALVLGLVDDRLGAEGRTERLALAAELGAIATSGALGDFPDRYRLALAARSMRASEPVDSWLARQVSEAEEWMQRDAALEALSTRTPSAVLAHALADGYPRVRVRAVSLASEMGQRDAVMAALADGWPTVRATAVRALNDSRTATAALSDGVALVRRAGIEVLTGLRDRGALEAIGERLVDRDEWPEVLEAGLAYLETLCTQDAGALLVRVIERGAREGAWAPDVEVALDALAIALAIGGETAARAREAALSGGATVEAFEPVLSRESAIPRCTP